MTREQSTRPGGRTRTIRRPRSIRRCPRRGTSTPGCHRSRTRPTGGSAAGWIWSSTEQATVPPSSTSRPAKDSHVPAYGGLTCERWSAMASSGVGKKPGGPTSTTEGGGAVGVGATVVTGAVGSGVADVVGATLVGGTDVGGAAPAAGSVVSTVSMGSAVSIGVATMTGPSPSLPPSSPRVSSERGNGADGERCEYRPERTGRYAARRGQGRAAARLQNPCPGSTGTRTTGSSSCRRECPPRSSAARSVGWCGRDLSQVWVDESTSVDPSAPPALDGDPGPQLALFEHE